VIVSAKTVWGEELLSLIHLPPIRRVDVFKALFGLLLDPVSVVAFPVLYDATSTDGCAQALATQLLFLLSPEDGSLNEEVEFFNSRRAKQDTAGLVETAAKVPPVIRFVLCCVPFSSDSTCRPRWITGSRAPWPGRYTRLWISSPALT